MFKLNRLAALVGTSLVGCSLLTCSICLAASSASGTTVQSGTSGTSVAAPASLDEEDGTNQETSQEYVEWQGTECQSCHEDESDSCENENTLAHRHQNVPCIGCHTDQNLGEIHQDVDKDSRTPRRLKETTVDETSCLICHEEDNIVEATGRLDVLVDGEGTIVNPHAMPDVEGHEDITCTSCHLAHESSEPGKEGKLLCLGCHHTNVYECNTCHSA